MSRWAVLALCAACNGGHPATADAPPDEPSADAAPDAPLPTLQGQETYIKASNTGAGDSFGSAVALSGDGLTLAVGAIFEASKATGIDGDQTDDSAQDAGAVYIYANTGGTWAQHAYVKASNTDAFDRFGASLALSADGNTLAVGAWNEASCATGVDGNQQDNMCGNSGAVYVFARDGGVWSQAAYLKPSNTPYANGYQKAFGQALALSGDGRTLAVGGPGDGSAATGIDGNQQDLTKALSGAVYVFTRSGTTWAQQAYVKASNTDASDVFGCSVALSADGDVMSVGAPGEASAARGVNGSQLDNSKREAGAVYIFRRAVGTWSQEAYVKASNPDSGDEFGNAVTLSADGTTVAVGAYGEASAATGVDGDQSDNSQLQAGAVYVFAKSAGEWAQQAYVKEAVSTNDDQFGMSVSLSADGNTLAAGAPMESGGGTGITMPQASKVANSGVVYVYRRAGATWARLDYIKASVTHPTDLFGESVALSSDSATLAVGALLEDSAATGVGGDQSDVSKPNSGAAYIIR